ncbi:MAG: hypothetical protein K6G83_00575 [Lachnospiraceae bacterium]|nr:hypothetical protein [Lachnospiraceae bacterium]
MMNEPDQLRISPMAKTWILDLDGTLVVHDGPFITGRDEFLPGAREFLESIPKRDMFIQEPGGPETGPARSLYQDISFLSEH